MCRMTRASARHHDPNTYRSSDSVVYIARRRLLIYVTTAVLSTPTHPSVLSGYTMEILWLVGRYNPTGIPMFGGGVRVAPIAGAVHWIKVLYFVKGAIPKMIRVVGWQQDV